ncbi:helix-turn-helix domain-containing protein, partial [Paraburkholderia unamae]|uniref:helix-turn-helix domain-containing protein n=1 Tax=Paraburkholderia unamae TaxID=219649 RepID=UPI001CC46868
NVEADEIRAALDACHGDRDRACEMLGISKTTLWRRLSGAKGKRGDRAAGPGDAAEPPEAGETARPRRTPRG